MDEKGYWIGFNRVSGIGPARLKSLLSHCGSIKEAWHAPRPLLREAGLSQKIIENLVAVRTHFNPETELERLASMGIDVVTWDDALYPTNLRPIPTLAPLLFIKGETSVEDEFAVALVGTRRATAYGREVARMLASELASAGVTVVSGLALGIDSVAHQAALEAGGRTIGVLGCGVDRVYPPSNRGLAERLARQGALISEYPPGTRPEAGNFPARNRVISGLSLHTVVIEAGERSGALITARFALEQGREVFAVPGPILSPTSQGCNRLIRDGATPLLSADDVLEQIDRRRPTPIPVQGSLLDPAESNLLEQLQMGPRHVDDIVRNLRLEPGDVTSLLTLMELKGLVRQVGSQRYARHHGPIESGSF